MYYDNLNTDFNFSNIVAYGGDGERKGGTGTIYWEDSTTASTLKLHNAGRIPHLFTPLWFGIRGDTTDDPSVFDFSLITGGQAKFNFNGNASELQFADLVISGGAQFHYTRGKVTTPTLTISGTNSYLRVNELTPLTSISISGSNAYLETNNVIADSIQVLNSSYVTSKTTTTSSEHSLTITATDLTVDASSRIDVSSKGYLENRTLGNAIRSGSDISGGSYGGYGGAWSGTQAEVYGDFKNPNELGSGAGVRDNGGAGGGLVRITADNLQLDGSILANGQSYRTTEHSSGGSGGGIFIDVLTLNGAGTINSIGGNGYSPGSWVGVGGGGGRIAIYFDGNEMDFNLANINVYGGSGERIGGAGTIYFEDIATMTSGMGVLIVNNNNRNGQYETPIRSISLGTISSIDSVALSFTDNTANFLIHDSVNNEIGLTGLWVQPDNTIEAFYRIIDNDATTIFVEDDANDPFVTVVDLGDTYKGVVILQSVFLRNNAKVTSNDPLVLRGGELFETNGGFWNGTVDELPTPTDYDLDGDTVFDAYEVANGTDPLDSDTDDDGADDGLDAFPLDPAQQ